MEKDKGNSGPFASYVAAAAGKLVERSWPRDETVSVAARQSHLA